MTETQQTGPEQNHLTELSPQDAVVNAAENIVAGEQQRLADSAGFLGDLAVPAPDLSKIDETMATMITINHGMQSED